MRPSKGLDMDHYNNKTENRKRYKQEDGFLSYFLNIKFPYRFSNIDTKRGSLDCVPDNIEIFLLTFKKQ